VRALISADMEGVTGVTCPDDVEPGSRSWEQCRVLLTRDVNAAVAGLFEAGASEVVVNEAHATKRNLLLDRLDERAVALVGRHKALGMMEGIDGADVVAFVGYHTGSGCRGVLSHTYLPSTISGVRVNGGNASEGRMNALLAAEFGVPVVLTTGDDLTCDEAREWSAEVVAVKDYVDRYTARCLSPARTEAAIRAGAAAGLSRRNPPERPGGPFTVEVDFDATHPVAAVTAIPGVEAVGDRGIRFELPTMLEAIRCFKAVTVLAAASVEETYG
jgi:D-amino peptidase